MDDQIRLPLFNTRSLLVLVLGLVPQAVLAADCPYRQGSLDTYNSPCSADRKNTRLSQDTLGGARDSATGTTWRKDAPKVNGGAHYRQEKLGKVNTHENVTWRKDGLGNLHGSDGTIYRPNALGQFSRDGKTSLPPYLQGK